MVKKVVDWFIEESKWTFRVLLSSSDRFYWDNGLSKSAALAYSTLLSLVPLLFLCFGILGAFVQAGQHREIQEFLLRQFFPLDAIPSIITHLEQFQDGFRTLNVLAFTSLVVTALLLLNSVEFALNQVWQVYDSRSIANRITIFCSIIIVLPALGVSGYYTTLVVEPWLAGMGFIGAAYHAAFPVLVDFLAFLLLYFLVPKAPVRFSPSAFGALISAVLFGWSKALFAIYIARFSSYYDVYGTIAVILVSLFWLYIAWTIVLFGAEVSYQSQNLPRNGKLWSRSVMTVGDGAMLLAAQALVLIVRAYRSGTKPPNELEVAEQLGCSSVVLKPTLDALERASIVTRGDGRDAPLLLMRSPEAVTLAEIREALFKKRDALLFPVELGRIFMACGDSGCLSAISLADITKES